MNFNYQLYVNRLHYQPDQWPPDISLAELHSRVSEQGPINENGVKCPCCNYQSKKKFRNWFSRDIHEVPQLLHRTAAASAQPCRPTSACSNSTSQPSSW